MDVHLRDLRYFVTTAEYLHFTRAAEALFVSQPALSKQIRLLERQLRAPLFERDRRSVHLTPVGEALLPQAREVLAAWDHGQRLLAAATHTQEATLLVGFSTGLGRGLLPEIRTLLADSAPQAQLLLRQISWEDPTGGLTAHGAKRTDAAFVWLPLPESHTFEWMDVVTESRLVALPSGHPLADLPHVDFSDLLDEPFLALPTASGALRDYWLATEERRGHPVRIGAEISSTEEAVEALAARLGVCLIAAGNASLVTRDGVVVRPVVGLSPSRLVLAWRRGDDRPLLTALRQAVLVAAAAENPPGT
jgi:DNA-binding transcriptional LysR family regulator